MVKTAKDWRKEAIHAMMDNARAMGSGDDEYTNFDYEFRKVIERLGPDYAEQEEFKVWRDVRLTADCLIEEDPVEGYAEADRQIAHNALSDVAADTILGHVKFTDDEFEDVTHRILNAQPPKGTGWTSGKPAPKDVAQDMLREIRHKPAYLPPIQPTKGRYVTPHEFAPKFGGGGQFRVEHAVLASAVLLFGVLSGFR